MGDQLSPIRTRLRSYGVQSPKKDGHDALVDGLQPRRSSRPRGGVDLYDAADYGPFGDRIPSAVAPDSIRSLHGLGRLVQSSGHLTESIVRAETADGDADYDLDEQPPPVRNRVQRARLTYDAGAAATSQGAGPTSQGAGPTVTVRS